MTEIKRMPISEFREFGFLQEVNRLFFHPLGLAMEVVCHGDGETLGGIWDYRDDPEGMAFGEDPEAEKAARVQVLKASKVEARLKLFGYEIQPAPGYDCPQRGSDE